MEKDNRDLQLLELKDTITQLRGVIQTLQDTIAAGQKRETALQEQIDYLTKNSSVHRVKNMPLPCRDR